MTAPASPFRPLLASLLCGMIALGHVPAWLHVADCDGRMHVAHVHLEAADSDGCCSHHDHQHRHQHGLEDSAHSTGHSAGDDQSSHQDHDSDSCVICQSLAAPTGFTSGLTASPAIEPAPEPLATLDAAGPADAYLSIPQPRGPPAIAA